MPAPTAWPIILAFGATLLFAGIVTNPGVSVLGGVLMVFGATGWFRQVLPREMHEHLPVIVQNIVIATARHGVER